MHRSTTIVAAVAAVAAAIGAAALTFNVAGAGGDSLTVELRDAGGDARGTVEFHSTEDHTEVTVQITSSPDGMALDAFHGFHIHANDDPANGQGCIADPDQPSKTWFVAVDGHWKVDGETHGHHHGDMPSLLIQDDGTATSSFVTDRIDLGDLHGKAVILHAGADNFANVPIGTEGNQYSANSDDATKATANTANAGDRVLCGELD